MSDQPIRVLHVLGMLNRGGAESMVMNIYRNIDRKKIQFDFIVHGKEKGDYEAEILRLGGRIYRLPSYKVYNHSQYKSSWHKHFTSHPEHKIIHGHMTSTASIYMKIAKLYTRLSISHSHNTSTNPGIKSIVKQMLRKSLPDIPNELLACSTEAGKWLYGNRDFKILKNAIDTDKFKFDIERRNYKRTELGIANEFVVGHVGRLTYQKNHEFLLYIFSEIIKDVPNARLLLVGQGELEKDIKKKINELGLDDKVELLGVRADVNELIQAFDVFIMPSYFEGLPVTLVEAQAASLPCVVSDTITKDINITKYIEYISLEKSSREWAKLTSTLVSELPERVPDTECIFSNGFDINTSSNWYQQYILNLVN